MEVNWKLRLQNKATLTALITEAVSYVYTVFSMLGITPSIPKEVLLVLLLGPIPILVLAGIIADPSTKGISDSCRALERDEPAPNATEEDYCSETVDTYVPRHMSSTDSAKG